MQKTQPCTLLLISKLTQEILQKDLESLEKWEKLWDMSFNPSKFQVNHVTQCKTPSESHAKYLLHGCVLESVPSAKYLGVTISEDLKWTDRINDISKKAEERSGAADRASDFGPRGPWFDSPLVHISLWP